MSELKYKDEISNAIHLLAYQNMEHDKADELTGLLLSYCDAPKRKISNFPSDFYDEAKTIIDKYGINGGIGRCDEIINDYSKDINGLRYYDSEKISLWQNKINFFQSVKIIIKEIS